jgi:glycylpeptide N-tetradecanoyltransferase
MFLTQKNIGKGESEIIGFTSFYTLPSTVMHHPNYKNIKAAYSFYNFGSNDVTLHDVMQEALIVSRNVCNFTYLI